jgi:hypothetical protein
MFNDIQRAKFVGLLACPGMALFAIPGFAQERTAGVQRLIKGSSHSVVASFEGNL